MKELYSIDSILRSCGLIIVAISIILIALYSQDQSLLLVSSRIQPSTLVVTLGVGLSVIAYSLLLWVCDGEKKID
jgi:hypothetical protein